MTSSDLPPLEACDALGPYLPGATGFSNDVDGMDIALAYLLAMPPVTAFLALNFTGSTTYTSRSGVRHEIYTYIPIMAWTFGLGIVLTVVLALI